MKTKQTIQTLLSILLATIFMAITAELSGQSLKVISFDVTGSGQITTGHNCTPPPQNCDVQSHSTVPWVEDGTLWGVTYDYIAGRSYSNHCTSDCGTTRANNSSHLYILGDETSDMEINWRQYAHVYTLVETDNYNATAENSMEFDIEVRINPGSGFQEGDPVVFYYQFDFFAMAWTNHEDDINHEDPVSTENVLRFEEQDLIGTNFNFNSPGQFGRGGHKFIKTGNIMANVGDTIDLSFESTDDAEIAFPGYSYMAKLKDKATCDVKGNVIFGFSPIPEAPDPVEGRIDFSVDIGSDTELSDPNQDGDEVFDPGDAYPMQGPYFASPSNGIIDDFDMFGVDPAPVPGDVLTNVPCGMGELNYTPDMFFNVNGIAVMEADLQDLSYGQGEFIGYFEDSLVFHADHLLISYADNWAENWAYDQSGYYSVPVNSGSTFQNNTYGQTAHADEVIPVTLSSKNIPSSPVGLDSLWSETDIHPNFQPDPDTSIHDDDINALTYYPHPNINGRYYFTVSNEAHYGYNPGSVYEWLSSGVCLEVVNAQTHLGLADSVDVDAIEFAWVWDSLANPQAYKLALLFSVAADDWTTSKDESGGLDPCMVYYSFLDSTHYAFSHEPMDENVDALTATPYSFIAYPPEIDNDFPVAMQTKTQKEHIKIYPNPTHHKVCIEGKNIQNILLYAPDGRHLQRISVNGNTTTISLDNLSSGVYVVKIKTDGDVYVRKIIRQ